MIVIGTSWQGGQDSLPGYLVLSSFSDLTLQVTHSAHIISTIKNPTLANSKYTILYPVPPALNPRIIRLHNRIRSRKRIPSTTSRIQRIIINQAHRINQRRLLEELESESLERVPTDVAVHEPGARVVGFEGEDEVA